jgi:hypothetical protein
MSRKYPYLTNAPIYAITAGKDGAGMALSASDKAV